MEVIKTFDIIFVFIICIGITGGSLGYLVSQFIFFIIDYIRSWYKKHR